MIIPDTNVCLHYSINHRLRLNGTVLPFQLGDSSAMTAYLDPEIANGGIRIIEKVREETVHKLWDLNCEKGRKINLPAQTIYRLVSASFGRFNKLHVADVIPTNLELYSDVSRMYAEIWSDPSKNSKKTNWSRRKRIPVEGGPPRGNDLEILSTAAKLASGDSVRLLTFDNDFIAFSDEISREFGIEVVNAHLLRSRQQ